MQKRLLFLCLLVVAVCSGCITTPRMVYQPLEVDLEDVAPATEVVIYEEAPPTVVVGIDPLFLPTEVYFWGGYYHHYDVVVGRYVVVTDIGLRGRYEGFHYRQRQGMRPNHHEGRPGGPGGHHQGRGPRADGHRGGQNRGQASDVGVRRPQGNNVQRQEGVSKGRATKGEASVQRQTPQVQQPQAPKIQQRPTVERQTPKVQQRQTPQVQRQAPVQRQTPQIQQRPTVQRQTPQVQRQVPRPQQRPMPVQRQIRKK